MLTTYLSQTRRLLQNPAAPTPLYSDPDLTLAINEARQQLAAESASIRVLGTLAATAANAGPYAFSSIVVTGTPGVASVLNIRTLWRVSGSGKIWIGPRSFEWFSTYELNTATPGSGPAVEWAQYGQGNTGSLYLSPVPNANVSLVADSVCLPIDLVDDTTVEAIPPLWTNAVQYYAAYVALLGAQTGVRMEGAQKFLELYELFTKRARQFATPEILPLQNPQSTAQQPVPAKGQAA